MFSHQLLNTFTFYLSVSLIFPVLNVIKYFNIILIPYYQIPCKTPPSENQYIFFNPFEIPPLFSKNISVKKIERKNTWNKIIWNTIIINMRFPYPYDLIFEFFGRILGNTVINI